MAPRKDKKPQATTSRIDDALGVSGRTQLPPADLIARFQQAIGDGTLSVIINRAFAAVITAVPTTPAGKCCAIRDVADVKAVAGSNGADQSMLFSGTLSQLDLQSPAASTIDCGRINQLLECAFVSDLRSMLGPIIINFDAWICDTAQGLMRCNCDAEVTTLALVRFWRAGDATVIADIDATATDLTFDCKKFGGVGGDCVVIWLIVSHPFSAKIAILLKRRLLSDWRSLWLRMA